MPADKLDPQLVYGYANRGFTNPDEAEAFATAVYANRFGFSPQSSLKDMTAAVHGVALDPTASVNNIRGWYAPINVEEDPLDAFNKLSPESQQLEAYNRADEGKKPEWAASPISALKFLGETVSGQTKDRTPFEELSDAEKQKLTTEYRNRLWSQSRKHQILDLESSLPPVIVRHVRLGVARKDVDYLSSLKTVPGIDTKSVDSLIAAYTDGYAPGFAGTKDVIVDAFKRVQDHEMAVADWIERGMKSDMEGDNFYQSLRSMLGNEKLAQLVNPHTGEPVSKDAADQIRTALLSLTPDWRNADKMMANFPERFLAGKAESESIAAKLATKKAMQRAPDPQDGLVMRSFNNVIGSIPDLALGIAAAGVAGPLAMPAYFSTHMLETYNDLVYEGGLTKTEAATITLPAAVAYGLAANWHVETLKPLEGVERKAFVDAFQKHVAAGYGKVLAEIGKHAAVSTGTTALPMLGMSAVQEAAHAAAEDVYGAQGPGTVKRVQQWMDQIIPTLVEAAMFRVVPTGLDAAAGIISVPKIRELAETQKPGAPAKDVEFERHLESVGVDPLNPAEGKLPDGLVNAFRAEPDSAARRKLVEIGRAHV